MEENHIQVSFKPIRGYRTAFVIILIVALLYFISIFTIG